jgi:hypothetical protein
MRTLQWLVCGACTALTLTPRPTSAQSGTIPPLTPKQIEERRRDNATDTAVQGVTSVPGMILDGSKIIAQTVDPASARSAIKGADVGSNIISYSLTGAKIAIGTGTDGWEGFKREGTQAAVEKGVDLAGDVAKGLAIRSAVATGVGLGTATGAIGIAYTGGSVFGTYLRNSVDVGQSLGLRSTVGDEVDTFWFSQTPDALKELASGTKQVNIDDPAVMQQMRESAERNRRQAMFDNIQRENLAQKQQMQAASVQMSGELSAPPPAPSPYDATAMSMQAILDAARASQAARPSLVMPREPVGASGGGGCKLDPQTGCHPGHDEKSHPGGCKKC